MPNAFSRVEFMARMFVPGSRYARNPARFYFWLGAEAERV